MARFGTDWKSFEGCLGRLVGSSEAQHGNSGASTLHSPHASPRTSLVSPRTGWFKDRPAAQLIKFDDFQSCLSKAASEPASFETDHNTIHGDHKRIQSRLLDFIQTKAPRDLKSSSNLGGSSSNLSGQGVKPPSASPSHSPRNWLSPRTGWIIDRPSVHQQKQLQRLSRMPFRQLLLYAKVNGVEERAANMALDCDELIQLILALPEVDSTTEVIRSVSLSLTREESLEALATLSARGQVDLQTSLGRLPQIGETKQCSPERQTKQPGRARRDDPAAALRQRYANATGSGLPSFFEQLHRLNHRLEGTEDDSRITCYEHEPFEAAPAAAYDTLTPTSAADNHTVTPTQTHVPTPVADTASVNRSPQNTPVDRVVGHENTPVDRMVGHELPYSWQLAHELMVDDSFGLSADGLVLPDPIQRRAVQIFLRAADDSDQQQLTDAMAQMSSNPQSAVELEVVLTKVLGRIASCLESMQSVSSCEGASAVKDLLNTSFIGSSGSLHRVESTAVHDLLNASYIVQMVKGGAYGSDQLRQLIRYVCNMAADLSVLEAPPILSWLDRAEAQVTAAQGEEQLMVQLAPPLLLQLIGQLTELYTLEKNARLAMHRDALMLVGAEYEREQVAAAVYRGDLTLDRTAPWLDAAWVALGRPQLSREVIVRTHRLAMQTLITRLALENNHEVTTDKLPEILALDCVRMSGFRSDVRKLAIGAALYTVAKSVLKSVGVPLSDSESTELQNDLLQLLDKVRNSEALTSGAVGLLQTAAGGQLSKLPTKQQLMDALKMATSRRQSSNLRTLFSERIAAAVVTVSLSDDQVDSSLGSVKEQLKPIAAKVNKLCSHLEQAYAQLYTALLGSGQQ